MNYTGLFESIREKACSGTAADIDSIMSELETADLPVTRAVDFYLGFVENENGIARLKHYLFSGSLIQRNYCALYFERRNEWGLINRAFKSGCIDAVQAYSR